MPTFSVAEARDNLSRLIREAESGKEVRLTRRGKPVAMLIGTARFEEIGKGEEETGFAERYQAFRERFDLAQLDIDPTEVFAGTRGRDTGRDFRW